MKRAIGPGSSRLQTRHFVRGARGRIFRNLRACKVLLKQSMPDAAAVNSAALASRIRVAARALAKAGLVHAYGHCSARLGQHDFLVSPAKPLALVAKQDALVIVPTTGKLPVGALPEVIAHQHIYRQRAEVGGVVRFQSPHVMALSALGRTPRALHGLGAYFAPCPPLHSDPRLVRDDKSAAALAERMGGSRAIVLRGNGAITAGASIEEAVALAWYLEDAARVELAVLNTGLEPQEFTPAEVRDRAIDVGSMLRRMWNWMSADDPEL
jgi:HCOMODA/2-hydroxy-3-carboxy-muconic semialdehyde decarboxylase